MQLAMDFGPQSDVDRCAIRRQIDEMYEILARDEGEKNVVGARNAFDLQEVIRVGIAPSEGDVVSWKRRTGRRADDLRDQACATLGARAGRLSLDGPGKPEQEEKRSWEAEMGNAGELAGFDHGGAGIRQRLAQTPGSVVISGLGQRSYRFAINCNFEFGFHNVLHPWRERFDRWPRC